MPSLLFLCHRIPFPPNKGEKIRAFKILEFLARRYAIRLGCFVDTPEDWAHVKALEPFCTEVHCVDLPARTSWLRAARGMALGMPLSISSFGSAAMAAWVRTTFAADPPDVIYLYSSAMAQFMTSPRVRSRLIMDFVDVDSDKWSQYARDASWPMRWIYQREASRLIAFDRAVAAVSDASLFVSEDEAALFRRLAPDAAYKIHAIANGVDCTYFSPAGTYTNPFTGDGPHLVFTGTMDYRPNVDAVTWFAADIFPLIRASQLRATFTIAGAKPARQVMQLAQLPGIAVTGSVPDVRPYLAHASAVVAPLRIARGIQNKVLEGMAMGKPVVTTPQGLEGIAAEPGKDLFVAETEKNFAAQVAVAISPLGRAVGEAARILVNDHYSWPGRLSGLERLMRTPG